MRIYNAIVLLDEVGDPLKHFATKVEKQIKTIETRMKNMIPEGDIVICCGAESMTVNRCKALCIVYVAKGRRMTAEDETAACIEATDKQGNVRWAFPLSNWRYFSRKFEFSKRYVSGSFQSIFQISIPDDVQIINE